MWLWVLLVLSPVLGQQEDLKMLTGAGDPPLPELPEPTPEERSSPVVIPLSAPEALIQTDVDTRSRCFAVWRHTCPPITERCRCKAIDNTSAVCCDLSNTFQISEGLGCEHVKNVNLTRIHLWNVSLHDLDILSKRNLTSITVSQSHLKRVKISGSAACLNLSGNIIDEITVNAFSELKELQFLSLANISLTKLPQFENNITLDLMGNLSVDCSELLPYLTNYPNIQFINENATFCTKKNQLGWFNSTERVALSETRIVHDIEEDCVPGCECKVHTFNMVPGQLNHYSIIVNCSSRGLSALPTKLPPNVITLDVSNNNITSLESLIHEPSYRGIRFFHANSNQISSILPLESSYFIERFRDLSLKRNEIISLPTYIFNSAFDRTVAAEVFLGYNKLVCNCSVAQGVKIWLLTNRKFIKDYDQIFCKNMVERVIDLDPNKVCIYERDWTDYIYFIIAGEVTLLVLLVGKVSYDYWVFKTAGYLPWPASKMPKLPCDWVFE